MHTFAQATVKVKNKNCQTGVNVCHPLKPDVSRVMKIYENAMARSPERDVFLACQDVQKSGKPSVRRTEGYVVREEIYGNDILSYIMPEISVPSEFLSYSQKVKISGNVVKVKSYEKPQIRGYQRSKEKTAKERTPEEIARQAKANGNRARDKLIDITNSMFGMRSRQNYEGNKSVKFLTLTYKQNMLDLDRVHCDFVKFIDRLEYELQEKVEYLAVPEIQKERQETTGFTVWHIHIMLYCAFIDAPRKGHANGETWLERNWNAESGQGSFQLNEVETVGNLGSYLAKYLEKTFLEEGVLPGNHRYWHSSGLKDRSVNLYAHQPAFRLLDFLDYFDGYIMTKKNGDPAVRMGHYGEGNEYTGRVDFLDITLKPCPEVAELLRTLADYLGTT